LSSFGVPPESIRLHHALVATLEASPIRTIE
jgi:hypothetical protein